VSLKSILVFLYSILFTSAAFAQGRYLQPVFSEVDTIKAVAYGEAPDYTGSIKPLLLDYYAPKGDNVAKPLFILIHGGGFQVGQGDRTLPHLVHYADTLAKYGYAVVSVDYRLDTVFNGKVIMNAMHDVRAAIRYFKRYQDQYHIDTNKIVVGGESAGAMIAVYVTYVDKESELLSGAFPPTVEGNSGNPGYSGSVDRCIDLCGFVLDTTMIDHANDPPIMVMHGTNDPLVNISQGVNIALRARNIGLVSQFYPLYGAGHIPWYEGAAKSKEYMDTLVTRTVAFFAPFALTNSVTEKPVKELSLSVYPNPAKNELRISFRSQEFVRYFEVVDLLGRSQKVSVKGKYSGSQVLDISHLSKGVYLFRVQLGNESVTRSFQVE